MNIEEIEYCKCFNSGKGISCFTGCCTQCAKPIKDYTKEIEEEKTKQSDLLAVGFAKFCVRTQIFGVYTYEVALEMYKQENNL